MDKFDKFRRQLKDEMERISHGDFDSQSRNAEFNKMLNEFMDRLITVAENEKRRHSSQRLSGTTCKETVVAVLLK